MKRISSPHNPLVREFAEAGRRPSAERFLAEGPNLVEAALACGARMDAVFITEAFLKKQSGKRFSGAVFERVLEHAFIVPEAIMKKASSTVSPQGMAAIAGVRPPALEDIVVRGKKPALISVSDGIKEPGNMGSLIRLADAAGADACVVLAGSCNPYSAKSLRASAGSFFNLPVVETDLESLLKWLRAKTISLIGADADGGKSLFEADLTRPAAIAFGEEAHGLSQAVRRTAEFLLRIPIAGRAESLNVAASSAVILFEALRQRAGQKLKNTP